MSMIFVFFTLFHSFLSVFHKVRDPNLHVTAPIFVCFSLFRLLFHLLRLGTSICVNSHVFPFFFLLRFIPF